MIDLARPFTLPQTWHMPNRTGAKRSREPLPAQSRAHWSLLVDSLPLIEMLHVNDSLCAIHVDQRSKVTNAKLEDICTFVMLQKSKWLTSQQAQFLADPLGN
jgi:hypothetical protein